MLCAVFSPDGSTVLTGSKDKSAQLWRVATTRPVGPPFAHEGSVYSVAFSPDRLTVATASGDATARLWDIATGRPLGPAIRHRGMVTSLAFSPDGRRLITASGNNSARISEVPRTFDAPAKRWTVWVETLCGLELTANEGVGVLSPEDWRKCRQELDDLGGPPVGRR